MADTVERSPARHRPWWGWWRRPRSRAPEPADHEPGDRFDRRLIVPMVLGAILNPVNSTLIAVALVPIGVALGAPASQTAWLVSGLYLATAVGQPVVGRLVDLYGSRRLFLVGAVLVGIGGVVGALAPALWVLVVARVLIGLGTCAGYPAAMALIRGEADRTGQDSPAGILTLLAVSTQTISVIGPTAGGFLIGLAGWRATFTVNVPLAALSVAFGALWLPRMPTPDASDAPSHALDARNSTSSTRDHATERTPSSLRAVAHHIDLTGIGLFTVTLVSLLLFLTHLRASWSWLLAITVVAAVGFVVRERRAATPFLDLPVLAGNRPLIATYARSLLTATTSYSLIYGYTQWLEQGRGLSPTASGLALLPIFATGLGVSVLTGRRPEIRAKLVVGSAAQVAVGAMLLVLGPSSAIWLIVVIALVAGLPQGLLNLANQNAVYYQADPARLASSAGLLRTFFYLGAITASTVGGFAFRPRADSAGLHELALVMLGAAVLCLVLTLADHSLRHVVPRPDEPA